MHPFKACFDDENIPAHLHISAHAFVVDIVRQALGKLHTATAASRAGLSNATLKNVRNLLRRHDSFSSGARSNWVKIAA